MFSGKTSVFAGVALMLIGAMMFTGCSWWGGDDNGGAAGEGNPDALFLDQALQGSMTSSALSEVATDKAMDERVKSYAEMMTKEHEQLNEMITDLADRIEADVTDDIHDSNQRSIDRMDDLEDVNFDREYITRMLAEHTRLVSLFEDRARNATDPQVMQFAQQMLPSQQAHLEQTRRLAQEIGAQQPGAAGLGVQPAPKNNYRR